MNPRATLRFWPLQLAGWLAFGVAMGLSRISSYPLDYMLATKSALAFLGFTVSLGLRVVYRQLLQRELPLSVIIVILVTVSYAAAFPWTAAYNLIDARVYELTTGRTLRYVTLTGGALYHAFVLVAWSVLYLGVRQYAELQEGRERLLRAQALATEGRLSALRYQLNPHFLYNTLNAISTLVLDHRTADATRMIARLSDLLRVTLSDQATDEVTVANEIATLRQYLEIEQVRFEDRLAIHIQIAPDAQTLLLPTLILQPLVENAIRHGVSARESGGSIEIRAERTGNTLRVTVDDDGVGFPPGHVDGSESTRSQSGSGNGFDGGSMGIGLRNCRERLHAHYGDQQRMTIGASPGGGARVTIELPARMSPAPRSHSA